MLAEELASTLLALHRLKTARNRLTADRARSDTKDWQVKRRERTRQLIELGGLVAKSGLIDLTSDDRAVILGILIDAAATLRGEDRDQAQTLWRRRGIRQFALTSGRNSLSSHLDEDASSDDNFAIKRALS